MYLPKIFCSSNITSDVFQIITRNSYARGGNGVKSIGSGTWSGSNISIHNWSLPLFVKEQKIVID